MRQSQVKFALQEATHNATNVTLFAQVEFKVAGTYYMEVLVDDVMKLRFPLPVILVQQPRPANNRGRVEARRLRAPKLRRAPNPPERTGCRWRRPSALRPPTRSLTTNPRARRGQPPRLRRGSWRPQSGGR
jgi:hypothetical protein